MKNNSDKKLKNLDPTVAPAGMRREVKDGVSRIPDPSEESVIEAKKWVETNQK